MTVKRPSFFFGIARLMDFGRQLRPPYDKQNGKFTSLPPVEKSLSNDWRAISQDMRIAIGKLGLD